MGAGYDEREDQEEGGDAEVREAAEREAAERERAVEGERAGLRYHSMRCMIVLGMMICMIGPRRKSSTWCEITVRPVLSTGVVCCL
jgi:hypothetical protein